jgi:hypothetical protein
MHAAMYIDMHSASAVLLLRNEINKMDEHCLAPATSRAKTKKKHVKKLAKAR